MKKQNKWGALLLSATLMASPVLPINYGSIYASEVTPTPAPIGASMEVYRIKQVESSLQAGDTFSLKVEVNVKDISIKEGSEIYIDEVKVSGSSIDAKNVSYDLETASSGKIYTGLHTVVISGLKYKGGAKDVSVSMNYVTTTGEELAVVSGSGTLTAKTSEDLKESLVIDKQENLVVKTGQTQSVSVKLSNKGTTAINEAGLKLSLDEKVKDLEIKTDTATIQNLKAKEIKEASFSIKVGEDVKAGVYKATVLVNDSLSYPINIQVDSNVVPSALEVSANASKVFTPGVEQEATFTIKNIGDRDAKNVRVEVVNSENVSIVGGSNVKHLPIVASKGTQEVKLNLRVDAGVTANSVSVPIKLTYLGSDGEQKEDTQYIYLSTSASKVSSEVVISNVISPTKTYGIDENFTFKFNLSSKNGAEKVKITVKGDEGIVPKSQNLFFLNKLGAGETKQYTVTFAATRSAVSSSHPIEISVEYGDGSEPVTLNQYGSVNITNPELDKKDEDEDDDKKKKGTPKVIIGQYKVDPVVVKAGEEFELEIGFLNTHKTQTVHNLKANLKIVEQGKENTGTVFTPVNASNTFYIADLAPGQTDTKTIRMYTIPSADPKTYEISLEMAYEDEEGNEVTATENIGIPVDQVTKVEVGDIVVDGGQVGVETYFSATLYNTGKTNVTNMIVHIEGEGFTVQDNKVFIGGFASQEQESYEPTIIPDTEGMLTGRLIIDYEDTTGTSQQIVEEFTFEAMPAMNFEENWGTEGDMGIPMDEVPQGGKKWPMIIGIGVGVVAAVIITIVILKKRKKKKEEMMLDEDE